MHVVQESIKGVQEEIGALKEGLVVERKKRHNKEVYEETCKDINKYPPHRATKARFAAKRPRCLCRESSSTLLYSVCLYRCRYKKLLLLHPYTGY